MNKVLSALKGLEHDPLLHRPVITAVNINNFLQWYKSRGGIVENLELPYSGDCFKPGSDQKWFSYFEHLFLQKKIIDSVDDFNLSMYFDMGYSILRNKMIGSYRAIIALIPRDAYFNLLCRLTKTFQTYTDLSITESGKGWCKARMDVDSNYNSYSLGGLAHNITGIICAAISFKFNTTCTYKIIRTQNLLENVVLCAYERYGLTYKDDDSFIWIQGQVIGRRLFSSDNQKTTGIEILKNFEQNGIVLLEKGMIFDAPYCEVEIHWGAQIPVYSRIGNVLQGIHARSHYKLELEAKLLDSQRRFFEASAAKEEALFLAKELEEKNKEMEELIHSLESRVEKRTGELKASLMRLKHQDVVKSNLLAALSHELRTPLAMIKGPLERILRADADYCISNSDKRLLDMSHQLDVVMDVLNGILDFTMLETDRNAMQMKPLDISQIIASVELNFALQISISGLTLDSHGCKTENLIIDGEPHLLRTAISNLLFNAIKYTPPGGTIIIQTSASGEFAAIAIQDNGPGIPEKEVGRIFDRFYRSAGSTYDTIQGSGLGLSLVKDIASAHKGTISYSDAPGGGSIFTLLLPLSMNDSEVIKNLDQTLLIPDRMAHEMSYHTQNRCIHTRDRKPHLLYVEDNRELSEFVSEGLAFAYDVDTAADGLHAFDLIQVHEYEIIISDVMMPGMSGIELLQRVNAMNSAVLPPFLFITAKADNDSKIKALEEGAIDYIQKPFDEMELQCKIENILRYKESIRSIERSSDFNCMENSAATRFRLLGLSKREIEVALLLSRGKSRKEIAFYLGIATATAKRHIENIYQKLGLQDRYQLLAKYMNTDKCDKSDVHRPPQ